MPGGKGPRPLNTNAADSLELLESFGTVTEFGAALAGFSALAVALTHRPGTFGPLDRFRTINLLLATLTPAFAAMFPMVGEAFGASGEALWRGTSLALAGVLMLVLATVLLFARSLPASDRSALSKVIWALFLVGHPLIALFQLINASGVLAPAGPGPILASLVWLLLMGAVQLVRIVLVRPVGPAA